MINAIKRFFLRAYCTLEMTAADWRGDYTESVYWSAQRDSLRS